jgi:hypothetical protein
MVDKEEGALNVDDEGHEAMEKTVKLERKGKAENDVLRVELDKLRSDVDRISQELKSAVNELKKSIVDIRSAISEIENPFNILRSVSSEEDLRKLEKKRLPPGVKSLVLGKPEMAPEEQKPEEKTRLFEEKPEPPPTESIEESQRQAPQFQPKSAYLDWVWHLLESGLSSDDVLQFAQACEVTGYLPAQSSEHVYSLALACERVRLKGFTKSQMLLSIYRGALTSGVGIGSDDLEKLISIVEGFSKKRIGEED